MQITDSQKKWRWYYKIGFRILPWGLCIILLISYGHLAREFSRNKGVKILREGEVYGEFYREYLHQFPVGRVQEDQVVLVDYSILDHQGTEVKYPHGQWEEATVTGTFRVRHDLHRELQDAAELVFEPQGHHSDSDEILSNYQTLLRAGRNAVPYVIPYLASGDLLTESYEQILPTSTKFSRCHKSIRTASQLASILMSLLTEETVTITRPKEWGLDREAFGPLWLVASYDFDSCCNEFVKINPSKQFPYGLEFGKVRYMVFLSEWESAVGRYKESEITEDENVDWVIVTANL